MSQTPNVLVELDSANAKNGAVDPSLVLLKI